VASGPRYVCPSHQCVAGTDQNTAATATTTQYAGRIRAARRSAYRRSRPVDPYSRKPERTKKIATPASKRASTAPPAPRPVSPVRNATWVSSTAPAATARSPSSAGNWRRPPIPTPYWRTGITMW
jgi:hypothetical protein